jgi:hypothetical protein
MGRSASDGRHLPQTIKDTRRTKIGQKRTWPVFLEASAPRRISELCAAGLCKKAPMATQQRIVSIPVIRDTFT